MLISRLNLCIFKLTMKEIEKKYILDENNKKVAVQIDINTFEKIEGVIEDYGLFRLMEDNEKEDYLDLDDAKKFYKDLDKAN